MTFLLLLPTILSLLVFCGHLLKNGLMLFVPPVALLLLLLFVKHGFIARFFQFLLMLISIQWLLVALFSAVKRSEEGQPWVRMVLILSGVAVLAFVAAALFESARLRERYPRRLAF
ncbi:MAG: hypothetical protein IPJ19_19350 [Planctomycetes bacterium]|nr:hypothetical protein [Planctomycetota bacterium]